MQFRKVTGEERERLLAGRKAQGADLTPYLDVLEDLEDGDVVAVTVGSATTRGTKIKFGRAASQLGKGLTWLRPSNPAEIAFQIGAPKAKQERTAGQRTRTRAS